MNHITLAHLERLFSVAAQTCNHRDFVIIGSLSILGFTSQPPNDMMMSNDVDAFTRLDPGRIFELNHVLGEGSPFDLENGFHLDPVSPRLPSFPEGWEERLKNIDFEGFVLRFADPNDSAVAKIIRGEDRDIRWIRSGLEAGLIDGALVLSGIRTAVVAYDYETAEALTRMDRLLRDALTGPTPSARPHP